MTKYEELFKNSDPQRVAKNALEYFGKDVRVYMSDKPNKKYMVKSPSGKYVHFGDIRYPDYTRLIKDNNPKAKERQRLYLARAMKIPGRWYDNYYSPNMLSINLTWM
jgi:hypothetical protein